jgi:hypothetical protein
MMMLFGGLRSVIRFGKQPRPRDLPRRIVANFLQGAVECGKGAGAVTPSVVGQGLPV